MLKSLQRQPYAAVNTVPGQPPAASNREVDGPPPQSMEGAEVIQASAFEVAKVRPAQRSVDENRPVVVHASPQRQDLAWTSGSVSSGPGDLDQAVADVTVHAMANTPGAASQAAQLRLDIDACVRALLCPCKALRDCVRESCTREKCADAGNSVLSAGGQGCEALGNCCGRALGLLKDILCCPVTKCGECCNGVCSGTSSSDLVCCCCCTDCNCDCNCDGGDCDCGGCDCNC